VTNASTTLPGEASSVPTARRWVESVLESWGYPVAGWSAAQIVSELATNCALHARSEYRVSVDATATAIRLEVADNSVAPPEQRRFSETATTGRGLQIVAALAQDWGVVTRTDGKTIWVELALDEDEPDPDRSRPVSLASHREASGSRTPRPDGTSVRAAA
jgi:anti-sigma regulatory factor (Ser/Thr protein kinase)